MKGYGYRMELSLNRTNNVPTNETPTPTRFIRNCEAIGLFQDLNPFEETFKNAVESAKEGTSKPHSESFLSRTAGDELHTPQVFPDVSDAIDHTADHMQSNDHIEEIVVRSEADTSINLERTSLSEDTLLHSNGHVSEESVHVLFEMPNGTVLQLSAKPVKNDGPDVREAIRIAPVKAETSDASILTAQNQNAAMVLPKQSSSNPLVKEKLKAFLDGSLKARQDKSISEFRPHQVSAAPKKRLPSISDELTTSQLAFESVNVTEEDKKKKMLERNRRAAYRCREKRKRHIENLVNTNRMLNQEVTALRAEVLRLQTMLMAHASCTLNDVTSCVIDSTGPSVGPSIGVVNANDICLAAIRPTKQRKESLTLDIVKATENSIMDLDSPSIVRCDEVLSSVAPPSTPDERIDPFAEMERDINEPMEKQSNPATTVIQINPNALKCSTSM